MSARWAAVIAIYTVGFTMLATAGVILLTLCFAVEGYWGIGAATAFAGAYSCGHAAWDASTAAEAER